MNPVPLAFIDATVQGRVARRLTHAAPQGTLDQSGHQDRSGVERELGAGPVPGLTRSRLIGEYLRHHHALKGTAISARARSGADQLAQDRADR